MDELRPRKWRQMVIFTSITFATLGFLVSIAETYSPEVPKELLSSPLGKFANRFIDISSMVGHRIIPPYDTQTRIITLAVNESVTLDRIRITYRGLAGNDRFKVETIVPSFDREMPFRYTVHTRDAEQGFRLYLDRFELISAKANRLQLRYLSDIRE